MSPTSIVTELWAAYTALINHQKNHQQLRKTQLENLATAIMQ